LDTARSVVGTVILVSKIKFQCNVAEKCGNA